MEVSLLVAVVAVVALAANVGLVIWDTGRRRRAYLRMRTTALKVYSAVRLVRGSSLLLRDVEVDDIDYDAPQPEYQMSHSHVWGANPSEEDATSRTYRCQVPRCSRIHSVMR